MKLPICRSIIDPNGLYSLISKNYVFNFPFKVSLLNVGDNDHYLVEAEEKKYVFRLYRHNKHWIQGENDYLFEIDILNFLKRHQIPVSYPIKKNDGSYIGTLTAPEGLRYWALFSFAEGDMMQFNEKNVYHYGQIISKIHNLLNEFRPKYPRFKADQTFLIDLPIKRIINFLNHNRKNEQSYLTTLAESLSYDFQDFTKKCEGDEWGLIGGDFHGLNHNSHADGNFTLFDFDLCSYGWRVYDLAIFKWALFDIYQGGKKTKNPQCLWNIFLKAYHINRNLNKHELKIIPAFVQARQIWLMGSETTYPDLVLNDKYWDMMLRGLKLAEAMRSDRL